MPVPLDMIYLGEPVLGGNEKRKRTNRVPRLDFSHTIMAKILIYEIRLLSIDILPVQ